MTCQLVANGDGLLTIPLEAKAVVSIARCNARYFDLDWTQSEPFFLALNENTVFLRLSQIFHDSPEKNSFIH